MAQRSGPSSVWSFLPDPCGVAGGVFFLACLGVGGGLWCFFSILSVLGSAPQAWPLDPGDRLPHLGLARSTAGGPGWPLRSGPVRTSAVGSGDR